MKEKIRIDKLKRKKGKIRETKISSYTPVPFPFHAVSKENKQIHSKNRG